MNYKPAFWLACACLMALVSFGIVDICVGGVGDSELVSGLIDLLKYVCATALGFFFASMVGNKKE